MNPARKAAFTCLHVDASSRMSSVALIYLQGWGL